MNAADEPTRILMVTGAGGSGKTAAARATASAAASLGRTLLITVGYAVEPRLEDQPLQYDRVHLNPIELLTRWWDSLSTTVRDSRHGSSARQTSSGFDPFALESAELTGFADAEYVLLLREIRSHGRSGEYRFVVVDGPSCEGLIPIMSAPASFAAYIERVWPRHIRLSHPSPSGGDGGALAALLLAEPLAGLAEQLAQFVADRSALEFVYVVAADRVTRARAELGCLEVLGLRPSALILNRVLQIDDRFALDLPHPAVQFVADRARANRVASEQTAAIANELSCALSVMPEGAAHGVDEPSTPPNFDGRALLESGRRQLAAPPQLRRPDGHGPDAQYEWALPLPLVDPTTIDLGRVDDDLVVSANGVRRRMRLPSVLRRCIVAGASFTEGELRVSFTPDPEVWPRVDR